VERCGFHVSGWAVDGSESRVEDWGVGGSLPATAAGARFQ